MKVRHIKRRYYSRHATFNGHVFYMSYCGKWYCSRKSAIEIFN